jgi:hypothetical protein
MNKQMISLIMSLFLFPAASLAAEATYVVPGAADPLYRTFTITGATAETNPSTGITTLNYRLPKFLDVNEKLVTLTGTAATDGTEFTLTSSYGDATCSVGDDQLLTCTVKYSELHSFADTRDFLMQHFQNPVERAERTAVMAAFHDDPIGVISMDASGI